MQETTTIDFPQGFAGEICKYFYEQSARPSKEISIAGGLALISAVCSNRYTIKGLGLNQYFMISAPTGAGVQSIYNGFDRLAKEIPELKNHFGDNNMLMKIENIDKSCIAMSQEIMTVIKRISSKNPSEHDIKLLRNILDLYNNENYNILGECNINEKIDESMILNGVIPRFLTIRCEDRSDLNPNKFKFDNSFLNGMRELMFSPKYCHVVISEDASLFLNEIKNQIENQIECESILSKAIMNRVVVKILKIAGLVAVANSCINPLVAVDDVVFANNIVMEDAVFLINKFKTKGNN